MPSSWRRRLWRTSAFPLRAACSAPAGSAAITARRTAARSCAYVMSPAAGRIFASTARAASCASAVVASAITFARYRSIAPVASAAAVAPLQGDR